MCDFLASDIEALAKLLTPQAAPSQASRKQDAQLSVRDLSKPTPAADLLPVKVAPPRALGRQGVKPPPAQPASAPAEEAAEEADDGRQTPEYACKYKQSVTTSDNFLGLSGKDPSSSCCEQLVVVVQLPLVKSAAEMQLDTTDQQLCLMTAHYKLRLCLPHKVDSERGSAKFDSKQKTLSITLPIVRDDACS